MIVLGPTASGKTALSLEIARRFQGEIVSCDSIALYREFEIGTAKPSFAERAEIPHHLLDCVDPLDDVTAGEYARRARKALHQIAARKHLPIVSGGTGLYLRALLEGLFPGPQRSEELRHKLRALAKNRGSEHLHRLLRRLDSDAANQIHSNDLPKVIRAIEVCLTARQPMTELWQQGREPLRGFRILKLGLNPEREKLYARINQRAAKMFDEGLVVEAEALLTKYGEQAWPLASLGYQQAVELLQGKVARENAIASAQQGHRNYAKRQLTWFRREPNVVWLPGFGDETAIRATALEAVQRQSSNSFEAQFSL